MHKVTHKIKILLRPLMLFVYKMHRTHVYRKAVLGRVACLGRDVFNMSFPAFSNSEILINQQKVRLDIFMEWVEGAKRPVANAVTPHLERDDIGKLIIEQEQLPWFAANKKISFLIMDSFAELTDQKFTHKTEGWSFCAHYSDLKHTPEFESTFSSEGLLSEDSFVETYRRFFTWFTKTHPGVPIFFIYYPTTLDEREKFKMRAIELKKAIEQMKKEFPMLQSIEVEDKDVSYHAKDQFPYHYGYSTMQVFDKKLRTLKAKYL